MNKPLKILYIEDSPFDVGLVEYALKKGNLFFEMRVVETEKEFTEVLVNYSPDIVLSDHSLPGFNSLEAYKIICEKRPEIPFILLTGSVSEEFAVDCLLAGMDDYILKSNLIRLPSSIARIQAKQKIKEEKIVVEKLLGELQSTYKQIELKNKEITDSITYAKRIQDAVLPNEKLFNREFQSGFVIYNPRDIVSGDLFWLAKTTTTDHRNLPLKVIGVFDCTGHGIPGAFMSLLSTALLNDSLKNPDINTPAEALANMNLKLPAILNRNSNEKITDGMDIAFCAFDLTIRTVYFSGANRPLWIVRKKEEGFELLDFKGTKASIGAHTSRSQVFEDVTIQLEIGDRLFLFTDGITDQFGGAYGKKLSRKRLKDVLLESAYLDMQLQKVYLCSFFTEWRGALDQVDDMLLIGIEIV